MKVITFDEAYTEVARAVLAKHEICSDDYDKVYAILDELKARLAPHVTECAAQRMLERDEDIAELVGKALVHAVRIRPLELKCPSCGAGPEHWRYLEGIENVREVKSVEGDTLIIDGHYRIPDGYDTDAIEFWFECHADHGTSECLCKWPVPANLKLEFV